MGGMREFRLQSPTPADEVFKILFPSDKPIQPDILFNEIPAEVRVGIVNLSQFTAFVVDNNGRLLGAIQIPRSVIDEFPPINGDRTLERKKAGIKFLLTAETKQEFGFAAKDLESSNG